MNKIENIISKTLNSTGEHGVRSNKKLFYLHGLIGEDIEKKIFSETKLKVNISSLGTNKSKEEIVAGRYMNKSIDITIMLDKKVIACVGLKFPISNIAQNINNYFENMLGETANIRSNNIPYFQIIMFPKIWFYFEKDGRFKEKSEINHNFLKKYFNLNDDNTNKYYHTPNKTLIQVYDFEINNAKKLDKAKYLNELTKIKGENIKLVEDLFEKVKPRSLVFSYEDFLTKIASYIKYEFI